ncbi:MAG: universal stress protein [Bacteroidales bacterium]|nr:universal stress protein [Bacteroidales bacterium]
MKSIIVGTDFSEGSYVALELAVDVANRLQCGILLVWVKREKKLFTSDQLEVMTHLAEDKLAELCKKYNPLMKHGTIHSSILTGKVSTAIAETAQRELAPMIVIGTNGASGFEKYFIGSQAARIVQDSPCPVLTMRQGYNFHKSLERIVCPIRVNANSRQKVPPAATMAKIFGSEVHVLGLLDLKEEESALRTYVGQSIDYLEKEGVPYHFEIRNYSSYSDTVLSYADEIKADLVIINTEQDKLISQLFLGTNAQQVVHKSQIPVLCIHPADYINVAAKV